MTGRNTKIIGAGLIAAGALAAIFLRSLDDQAPAPVVVPVEADLAARSDCWADFNKTKERIESDFEAKSGEFDGGSQEARSRILQDMADKLNAATDARIACGLEQR
jgi:hypothetical protein